MPKTKTTEQKHPELDRVIELTENYIAELTKIAKTAPLGSSAWIVLQAIDRAQTTVGHIHSARG